ncbi:MAG: hypothetical protein CMI30_03340 [Opitutae bacterium]|nr:hypothetical protein [Opitutae bacterium]
MCHGRGGKRMPSLAAICSGEACVVDNCFGASPKTETKGKQKIQKRVIGFKDYPLACIDQR